MSLSLQLAQDKFDFFPLNRALSLSVMDEGSTDSKVDELLQYVMNLVERQKEEVDHMNFLSCSVLILLHMCILLQNHSSADNYCTIQESLP